MSYRIRRFPGKLPLLVTTINGKFVKPASATISVFDNALLYAQGLFETFLAVNDNVIFGGDHLDRLYQGARVIDLAIPVPRRQLVKWMREILAAHPARIKKLRLTITAGESARWTERAGTPQVILSAAPHKLPETPFSLFVSSFTVEHKSLFRRIKTISYAIQATALREARKFHCDDAILINDRNRVAEVTSANIFWVKKGKIFTPGLEEGCLEGVTRRQVIKICNRLKIPLVEKSDTLDGMLKADEIFISSSLKLLIGVKSIRVDSSIHHIPSGEITRVLAEKIRALVGL